MGGGGAGWAGWVAGPGEDWVVGPGGEGTGQMDGLVGWYGLVVRNVYTARNGEAKNGECICRVKNTLWTVLYRKVGEIGGGGGL